MKITQDTVEPLCHVHYGQKLIAEKKEEIKTSGGKRGPYIPASIIEHYEASIVDPELVELREDIATIEGRARQLLKQIKESPHDNLAFIDSLKQRLDAMKKQIKNRSITYPELVHNVSTMLEEKVSEKILWNEYYRVQDMKRKLVLAETKRLNELGWTPEKIFAIIARISEIIKPLLNETSISLFFKSLANDPLFNNQQFRFVPQADLSQLALPDRLEAQIDLQAIEVEKQKDGSYAAEGDKDERTIDTGSGNSEDSLGKGLSEETSTGSAA